jgi:hypothetical protein
MSWFFFFFFGEILFIERVLMDLLFSSIKSVMDMVFQLGPRSKPRQGQRKNRYRLHLYLSVFCIISVLLYPGIYNMCVKVVKVMNHNWPSKI